jgi:hypothetical protein
VRIERGVYGDGPALPTELDRQRARVLASGRPARGALAGVLLGLDAIELDARPTRDSDTDRVVVVEGIRSGDGLQTLIDLAPLVDDDVWEQALESALRLRLTSIAEVEGALPRLSATRTPGVPRIRRVLGRRPRGAPPTGSRLETIALQLARCVPDLGEMTRQHEVRSTQGTFVAFVDLCNRELGVFFELDGQQHKGQPIYDAVRETAVVGATGWLPGRFTWHQCVRTPRSAIRQMAAVAAQALRRPRAG